ncbi:hypothetical protein BGS_0356 [Beggiatoa sp. SS]|nr:hypothetical protein BGS_0356 [Beggiatoa sp. SS]
MQGLGPMRRQKATNLAHMTTEIIEGEKNFRLKLINHTEETKIASNPEAIVTITGRRCHQHCNYHPAPTSPMKTAKASPSQSAVKAAE